MVNIAYLSLQGEVKDQTTIELSDDIWFYIERLQKGHLASNLSIKDLDGQQLPVVRIYKSSDTYQVFTRKPLVFNATYKLIPRVPKGSIKIKGEVYYER